MGWKDDPIVPAWQLDKLVQQAQGRSDATANAFGQGATLGFGDELAAGARAALPGLSNWMMKGPALQHAESIGGSPTPQTVSNAPDFQSRYDEELKRIRGQTKADAEAYPNLMTGANLAGGVATSALALPASVTAATPSLVGNILKMGATGGVLGGVQGFGEGEGGVGERATNAIMPAAAGTALGGLLPVAGAGGRKLLETAPGRYLSENVVSPLARLIAQKVEGGVGAKSLSAAAPDGSAGAQGPMTSFAESTGNVAQTGAVDRLATAMQRSGMTPEQISRKRGQLGDEAMIADLDPQFLSEARRANTLPGETKTTAKTVLESRDRQAGNRLTSAFEGSEPPPSAFALRGEGQAFDQHASAVGAEGYGALRAGGLKVSDEMWDLLKKRPIIGQAVQQIKEDAAQVGKVLDPITIVDRVKQKMNQIEAAAFASGRPINKMDLREAANEFEQAFWKANPKAQEAAATYRQAKSLPEHFDAGAALLARDGASENAIAKSAPALADLIAGADPQQKLAARVGATNAARSQAQESTRLARALAQRIDESAPVQSKLAQLYDPEHAANIVRQAGAEKQFAETSNQILKQSKTANIAAEVMDTGNAGFRVTPGGVTPKLWESAKDIVSKFSGPNEAVRDAIGRATLNPNSAETQRLLELIYASLKRRQQGSPLSAAIAGSSGASLAPNR